MKKTNKILFVIMIIFFTFNTKVLANVEITAREEILIDGKKVYKIYNYENEEKIGGDGAKLKITVNGEEYIGFCIELGINISIGSSETPADLNEYFKNALSETESQALIKKITQYIKFGYGSDGKNTDKYYLATQKLIWEAINDTGFYKSDFYKNRSGKTYDFKTIEWTTDQGATTIDLSNEVVNIKTSINNYYKTPSFCSNQSKIELEIGETAEYTDNNNVLSEYQVTCENGITCESLGNKLLVKAIGETGNYLINFRKEISGAKNMIYRHNNSQGVIINEGELEPVSCHFGIDTYKNVETSGKKIIYILTTGLFCGIVSYLTYSAKKTNKQKV